MITLNGRGYGAAPVYAPPVVLGDSDGRPTLPPELLTLALRNLKRGDEPQDVVLVAENAAVALLSPLPRGITLVGVIAEEDTPPPTTRLPVITGVSGAREALESAALVVLDPAHGRVLVDPEATEIARLQVGTHRARYLLGAAHTPAATQSGREIAVWASVLYRSEIEGALNEGADGIVVQPFGDLFTGGGDDLLDGLIRAAEVVGGGDLALVAGPDVLEPSMAVSLAARCRLRWVLSSQDLLLPVTELRRQLDDLVQSERDAGRPAAPPLLVASTPDLAAPETIHFDELFLEPEAIAGLPFEDALSLPPLRALVGEALEALPNAIAAAIAGVVVLPECVAAAKEIIREQE